MGRKKMKVTKTSKEKSVNRQAKQTDFMLIERLAKDFRTAPARLVAQCRKDLVVLKQYENKFSKELKKAQAQKKIARPHQIAKLDKVISYITAEIEIIKKRSLAVAQKQSQFTELGKQLLKLEKQLELKAKKPLKKNKKVTRKIQKTSIESGVNEVIIEPVVETEEASLAAKTEVGS